MKKIFTLLLLSVSTSIFAQLPSHLYTETEKISKFEEYDGTMYSKSRYKESSVIDERVGTFDAKLKYNVYTDALEYTKETELFQIIKNEKVHARIDGDYFYYCNFTSQRGLPRNGYYVLVELNDQYRIYKKYTLEIKSAENAVVNSGVQKGQLRMITDYYLEEDGVIMELPMDKKEILAAFNDTGELQGYLKKAKIRLRKEEDLIRFVARYNALKNSETDNFPKSLLSGLNRN